MRVFRVLLLSICTFASVLFFLSESAFASRINMPDESCEAHDVRDAMSPELKEFFMKPSHQGDVGWCFGYAASDVLSQKLGKPISAVHVSANYISRISSVGKWARGLLHGDTVTPEGGFIGSAIKDARKLGQVCTDDGVPFMGVFQVQPYAFSVGTGSFLTALKNYRENNCDSLCETVVDSGIKYYFSRLHVVDVKKYIMTTAETSLEKVFFALTDSSCANKRVNVPQKLSIESTTQQAYRPEHENYEPTRDIIYRLDRALERNKVVGLEYNAKYITHVGGVFGGFHASSIVARKTIGKQCHYLVRNSWGTSCNYSDGVICEKEQGGYWVNAKTLRHMTSKLVWIN